MALRVFVTPAPSASVISPSLSRILACPKMAWVSSTSARAKAWLKTQAILGPWMCASMGWGSKETCVNTYCCYLYLLSSKKSIFRPLIFFLNWLLFYEFLFAFETTSFGIFYTLSIRSVKVNLFQKPSFLHQLIHNMTRDRSLNFPPKKHKFRTCCVQKLFLFCFVLTFITIFVQNMFWICIFRGIQRTISRHIVG